MIQVDAPGVNVYSTSIDGGYGFSSGTSSAAAHVAGVAALVKSAKPGHFGVASAQRDFAGRDATGPRVRFHWSRECPCVRIIGGSGRDPSHVPSG